MAIELNKKIEKRDGSSLAVNFFLVIGILLLVLSGGAYFYLEKLNQDADLALKNADEEINQLRTEDVKNAEKDILDLSEKVKDYNLVFDSHLAPSNILTVLEQETHPKIVWSNFEFIAASSSQSGGTILEGIAADFTSLQQQLSIFAKDQGVQSIKLTNIELTKDGKIKFELNALLSPGVLTPKQQ